MGSVCTPSMRGERTPEPMMTDASCMKEDGMFSMLNFWRSLGRRKWMNGLADLNPNFQNGLEKDLARKLESQSLLTMMMKDRKLLEAQVLMKRKKKKKRRKRKNKPIFRNSKCKCHN